MILVCVVSVLLSWFESLLYSDSLRCAVRYHWNQTKITHPQSPISFIDGYFLVKDVGVNYFTLPVGSVCRFSSSLFARSAAKLRAESARVQAAIINKCWNAQLNRFISYYKDKNMRDVAVTTEAVQSLFPLLLPQLPAQMADSIVRSQVTNSSKFWLPFPIPSVSADAVRSVLCVGSFY